MNATLEALREELKDPEYSEGYAESFLDSYIATQIKVLREQASLSQQGLAELIGTRQGVISRIENVNYSKWNVSTLKKLARAFRLRLKVSFETYGSLLADVDVFSRQGLQRTPREKDPILHAVAASRHSGHTLPNATGKHHQVFISQGYRNAPGQLHQQLFGPHHGSTSWQFDSQSSVQRPQATSATERVLEAAG
jgi:transcriptional regulator with XRE-family HTH domain